MPGTVSLRTSLPQGQARACRHIPSPVRFNRTRLFPETLDLIPNYNCEKIEGRCSSVRETQHRHHEHPSCQDGALRRQCLHRPVLRWWKRTLEARHCLHTKSGSCSGDARISAIPGIPYICSSRACGAHARRPALLARTPAVMLAYLRSPAFLALVPFAVMIAYLRSSTFLAPAPAALLGHVLEPPRSLHQFLMWSCSHFCDPSHSLPWRVGQTIDPRQFLHLLLRQSSRRQMQPI